HGRPGHDEDDFQVEDDELDSDEVVAHIELHARVLERREPAFVRRQLLRSGALGAEQIAHHQQGDADTAGDDKEQQGRQVFGQHLCSLTSRLEPRCRGLGLWHRWCLESAPGCRLFSALLEWCPRGDSNPYDLSRYHLKVVRLPIPPPGHMIQPTADIHFDIPALSVIPTMTGRNHISVIVTRPPSLHA